MGYDLHITRKNHWIDEGPDIAFDEFVALVSSDPEFTYPGIGGSDYADWRSPVTGYDSWLHWDESGYLQTKNPKPELIEKMVLLAKMLDAKVQGDDGETYLSASEVVSPDEIIDPKEQKLADFSERWVPRVIYIIIIAAFLAFYITTRT